MASNAMTPEPGGQDCCCPCGSDSSGENNSGPLPAESSKIRQSEGMCVYAKFDTTDYYTYSGDETCCDECTELPVKTSSMSLGWNRMGGQEAAYFCYKDGWKPAGAGGVFSFLPEVNLHSLPDVNGRRVNSQDGTLAFDGSNVPQAELPISAKRDTTYFTTYDDVTGVYFEYFAGSSLSSSDARFGRPNRRYDPAGNSLQYNYTNNAEGRALLRSLSGNVGGNVVPYFYYADETVDPDEFAPITKVHVLDMAGIQNSRTTYYDYTNYQDAVSGNTWPYLSRIVHPTGCVQQFDPIVPFNDITDVYQLKRDVDAEGYQTYYTYDAGKLSKVNEPEGRVTYYEYLTGETRRIDLGRTPHFTVYDTGLGTGDMTLVTAERDPLGNSSYFIYDATLARMTKKIEPNGNLTYFDYVGGAVANKYALRRQVSAFNNATTYFGYEGERYDLVKHVGPRHGTGFSQATYYRYDSSRNRTARVDALGRTTLYGPDSLRHLIKEQDARGHTSYFNYSTTTGNLDSQANPEGNTTYYGYSSFRDLTKQVSPRWPEQSFQAFTTYYEYDQLSRTKKTIDPLGNVTYFDWTNRSQLLAQVDARGNEREYTYNGLRLMTRETITDRAGTLLEDTKHGYDLYKNRTQTLDGLGNKTYFFYDSVDRLIAQKDSLQQTTYFKYDSMVNRTAVRDARNNSTYFGYDLLSRNTAILDAQLNATYFFYDFSNNRTHVVDARLSATYFFYDELDRLQATRDALANPTYFYFDEVGNQIAQRNARFKTTYFFYDRANRQTSMRDALGKYTYFEYDAAGNRTETTDARLSVSRITYDTLNRPLIKTDPVGSPMAYQYDAVGNATAIERGRLGYGTQPYGTSAYGGGAGATTYFFYDGLSRTSAIRDALAGCTYFFYDLVGNRKSVRNPLLHSTYFGYDALNRLSRVRDTLGNATYFEFDQVGNQTQIVDPNNHALQTRFDSLNRADAVRFPDSGSGYFFYDQAGNQTRDLDPRGNTTYYGYDALNRAVRMQDALGRTVYFEYDPVSNLSREIGAEGDSAAYTYDAVDRPTNIAYAAAGSVISGSLRSDPYFIYDDVGNLTQVGDLWGLYRMGYDDANRMIRYQYPTAAGLYFEYDTRGNRITQLTIGGTIPLEMEYDSLDRQTRVSNAYMTYDAASNLTQKILGNGVRSDMTYDAVERPARWRASSLSGSPLTYFDYTRDNKGLITKASREATHTIYYTYDANDRLTMELWSKSGTPEVYAYRYAYDLGGNRIRERVNGTNTYYFYDRANQLTVKGANALFATPTYYTYDRNGNLTDLVEPTGTTKFAYNAAGLVARLRWRDASSTYFFYDGMLRRYSMIENGSASYFFWDGLNLLSEINADGTVEDSHAHAKTAIPGIGQLLETTRPNHPTPYQFLYPIMDPRGTINKWTIYEGETVMSSREYDAFGNIIPNSASGQPWPTRFGYQGQAWMEILSADGAQRLCLSPTRIYDPSIGRFTARDPIIKQALTNEGSRSRPLITGFKRRHHRDPLSLIQTYQYARQTPTRFVDPRGLQVLCFKPFIETGRAEASLVDVTCDPITESVLFPAVTALAMVEAWAKARETCSRAYGYCPIPILLGLEGKANCGCVSTPFLYSLDPSGKITPTEFAAEIACRVRARFTCTGGIIPPPPVKVPECDRRRSSDYEPSEGVNLQPVLVGAAAVTAGYLIYRGIRLLPSLLPPLWWTLPGNLAIP